ncbi:MAG: hypothetical protein QF371_00595 [Flavobacteriales bacterium]|nr:hypothetical protein [Flavobacteriales bacterium]
MQAQEKGLDGSKRERLEALKVAYLTKELSLTPEEAQSFWPLYNEMTKKMGETRKQRRSNRLSAKRNHGEMSDEDLSKAIDRELELEQQELDLKKAYNARFKEILPIRKVAWLHHAEKGFRKELLKGAKDRTKIPGGPPH